MTVCNLLKNSTKFQEYVVILSARALHEQHRHCLPAVSNDFALCGANFDGVGSNFARVYPRILYKKGLATPLPGAELTVMPIKHRKVTVALPQTKKPAPGMRDQSCRLEHQLLHRRLDAPALGSIVHRRVRLVQSVLPNQAQQVHRQSSQLAHQVDVKPATGQTLQIHVGLELRVKLLMGGMIAIRRKDVSCCKPAWRCRRPAFEHVLRQQQGDPALVNSALNQTVDTRGRVGIGVHTHQFQALMPDAFAFTRATLCPKRAGVGHPLCGNRLHRCSARVSLDDEDDFTFEFEGLCRDFSDQLDRSKTRIGSHQQRPQCKTCGHRQCALKVVLALGDRMLHIRAQCQFQAIAQAAQIHRKQAVDINTGVVASDQLFFGAPVVHGKGIEVRRGVATWQCAKVSGLAGNVATHQKLLHLGGKVKPGSSIGAHALAQSWTGRSSVQAKSTHEEGIASEVLDGVKVALAQTRQGQSDLEDVAVSNARAHGAQWIDQGVEFNSLEIFAYEYQTGMGTEVVGRLFDNIVGRDSLTFLVSSILHLSRDF